MKTRGMKTAFVFSCLVASATTVSPARAAGALMAAEELPAAARTQLQEAIALAHQSDPQSFADLAALRAKLPALDHSKRGEVVPVAVPIEDMGSRALWPIVEELAFGARGSDDLSPLAWRDWRVGLVEALGLLQEAKAEPVVLALLAKRDLGVPVLRASVEAAGRLGSRAAVARILALKPTDLAERRAVWEGMGECRRLACVQALGSVLASADAESSAIVARSIGRAASSWAWQTPSLVATGEGPAVRSAAARALMNVVPRASTSGRTAIFRALTVVNDPEIAVLARDLRRQADPELAHELDGLIKRIAP